MTIFFFFFWFFHFFPSLKMAIHLGYPFMSFPQLVFAGSLRITSWSPGNGRTSSVGNLGATKRQRRGATGPWHVLWTTQAPRSLVVWPSRRQCLCLIGMLGLLSWWLGWLQWRCPKYFRSFLEMRRSILLVGPSLGSWPLQRRLCSVSAANDFFLLQRLLIS